MKRITTEVPLRKMFGYVTKLRSLTQGKATFTMKFSRWVPMSQKAMNEVLNKGIDNK